MPPETESNTQTITIQSLEFTAPAPYAEGHVLNINEASTLNQVFGENLRNNFAKSIKDAMEKAGVKSAGELSDEIRSELLANFNKYAEEYTFGTRRVAAPADPVGREAYKIASAQVREALKARKMEVEKEKMDELVRKLLDKNPAIRQEAERRVNALKDIATDVLGDAA